MNENHEIFTGEEQDLLRQQLRHASEEARRIVQERGIKTNPRILEARAKGANI